MLPSAEIVRPPYERDALRAARFGRRLGEWSWRTTAAVVRTLIAAALAAGVWHAVVPAMAFGAYVTAILAVRLLSKPAELIVASARRAAGDETARASKRSPTAVARTSRVVIRPAVAVRLIALDLDGTVIGADLIVRERVRESIIRAQAQGIAVTIVTGRMFAATRPFARELGIAGPIVCYQGAGIFDVASGALVQSTPLAQDVTREVLAKAKADGFHAQCYAADRLYVEANNYFTHKYTALSQVEPVVVPSLIEKFTDEPTLKIVLVDEAPRATAYTETLKVLLGSRAYVTRSHPDFVEVLDPGVDKGRALHVVAAHYGVPLESTLAVGDSWNDLPLLKAAGMGIAMGSAPPELLARADAVVGDVAHDGVAEAIERYALA